MIQQKKQFQEHGTYVADETRQFVYTTFEMLMDRLKFIDQGALFRKALEPFYLFFLEGAQTDVSVCCAPYVKRHKHR